MTEVNQAIADLSRFFSKIFGFESGPGASNDFSDFMTLCYSSTVTTIDGLLNVPKTSNARSVDLTRESFGFVYVAVSECASSKISAKQFALSLSLHD